MALTSSGEDNTTFEGSISGFGNFNKSNTGILTLAGANDFTGDLNIDINSTL